MGTEEHELQGSRAFPAGPDGLLQEGLSGRETKNQTNQTKKEKNRKT